MRTSVQSERDGGRVAPQGTVMLTWIGPGTWRATDPSLPDGDPRSLLGFIEQRIDKFELMQIGDGFIWTSFSTLSRAVDYLVATGTRVAARRSEGDLAWVTANRTSYGPIAS